MTLGRGRGRQGGRRRRRVMSFLQPCLLVLLHQRSAHGYDLLDELEHFGFNLDVLDPSLVYRALREMEVAALVESEWGEESLGPQRRMYRITAEGEIFLGEWVADLQRTRQEIDSLLEAYERVEQKNEIQEDES
jgi:PadR family transcriptional regulator, regulatory protein PadR